MYNVHNLESYSIPELLITNVILMLLMPQQVRGDDVDDLTTYLVSFDEDAARYAVSTSIFIFINPLQIVYCLQVSLC